MVVRVFYARSASASTATFVVTGLATIARSNGICCTAPAAYSTLLIEIFGLNAGMEYDVLAISGTASLAGTLNVDLFDPGSGLFAPSLGDSFDILMADSAGILVT